MTVFTDASDFAAFDRSPMLPCTAPVASDFSEDTNTLIWCNINGEMRLYSYDGVNVQYQTLNLSAKTNA